MHVRHQVSLATLTTLEIGGPAATVIHHRDATEWDAVARLASADGFTPLTLGCGSNVLAADTGVQAPVIKMETSGLTFEEAPGGDAVLVTVQAGHLLQDLVDTAIAENLGGLESLTGIPGTVGATPIQNVGAYGIEVADTLTAVHAWDWQQRKTFRLGAADCHLGHRTSQFKHSDQWTILAVQFLLPRTKQSVPITYGQVADELGVKPGTSVPLAEAAEAVLAVRRSKGMVLDPTDPDHRSAGSVFLSPPVSIGQAAALTRQGMPLHHFADGTNRVSASWLIKQAGFSLGESLVPGVRISAKQYTLVTDGRATADDFTQAAAKIACAVEAHTGICLTPELDLFGAQPRYVQMRDGRQP
ncbi:UDP-N-acetylmuramate dehydrogenase [Streptacidiphilus pinicola]|uniref:UDP-N-acetylenolpyruvoylglucosamine reductase n=1 Tax=Streptacidiphilus pinicola TaxID=2219663 RepID=A0A2X0J0S0_9ACTN|nr:UDP-N-acetylmuramate dehydrogenase [Streptacidiphilus pinicola]RAG83796.1 UDP-N-acetylmuramate dehydrogenase [Streptacidiphilus pinicola]